MSAVMRLRRSRALVLSAVLSGARTYGEIKAATGMSHSGVKYALDWLRDAGLVAWENDRRGTLRPLVHVVPFESEH